MATAQSDLMDVEQCSVDETQLDVPRDDSKEDLEGTDLLEVISEHDHALNGSKLKFQIQRKKEAQSDTAVAYTLRVDTHVATITSFGSSARRNELPIRFEVLEPKNQLIELASDESSTSFCGRFIFAGEAVSLAFFVVCMTWHAVSADRHVPLHGGRGGEGQRHFWTVQSHHALHLSDYARGCPNESCRWRHHVRRHLLSIRLQKRSPGKRA